MKFRKTGALCTLAILLSLAAAAQKDGFRIAEPDHNKPRLFADLPERMTVQTAAMEALLELPIGATINTKATDYLPFRGTVVSKSEDAQVKSVVVRLANRYGATLTFSKTAQSDGRFAYIGRIISRQHGDAYDIIEENGQLLLKKKSIYEIMNE